MWSRCQGWRSDDRVVADTVVDGFAGGGGNGGGGGNRRGVVVRVSGVVHGGVQGLITFSAPRPAGRGGGSFATPSLRHSDLLSRNHFRYSVRAPSPPFLSPSARTFSSLHPTLGAGVDTENHRSLSTTSSPAAPLLFTCPSVCVFPCCLYLLIRLPACCVCAFVYQ